MALADFVKFDGPPMFRDVGPAVHVPSTLEHNDELSIPVEPVLKVIILNLVANFRDS